MNGSIEDSFSCDVSTRSMSETSDGIPDLIEGVDGSVSISDNGVKISGLA